VRPTIDAAFQRLWYGRSPLAWLWLPLSWVFVVVTAIRRGLYRAGILLAVRVAKPVIVVGNITVGGTGKTPLVAWLALALRERGFVPGIVTRGYGGSASGWPRDVNADSDATQIGDEAVLLARRTSAIVVAGPDRARAAQRAIERGANIVVADDGLQHYRLSRNFEIAVVDDARRFGNGFRLPAGPLRESIRRLRHVDALIRNCRTSSEDTRDPIEHPLVLIMHSRIDSARSLVSGASRKLHEFSGKRVNAAAGIANAQSFFDALTAHGLVVNARALGDHAPIKPSDLLFDDAAPVFITEKDAVKCGAITDPRVWVVPLEIELDGVDRLLTAISKHLDSAR